MRTDKRVVVFQLAGLLVLPLLFTGCELLPDQQDSRGVKLSDAMHASATGDQHDLGGRGSQETYDSSDTSASSSASGGGIAMAAVSYEKSEFDWQMLADVSYWQPINSDFESISHITLTPLAIEDDHNMLGIYVGGADVQLKSGSLPAQATDRTWMLDAGLTYRYYLNHARNGLSPYATASLGFNMLSWSYRNRITAGGDSFQSDSLYGAEGMLAIGISTRRDYRLSAFAEIGIGGTAFAPVTVNGFDNDVFNDFGFILFKAGVSLKF